MHHVRNMFHENLLVLQPNFSKYGRRRSSGVGEGVEGWQRLIPCCTARVLLLSIVLLKALLHHFRNFIIQIFRHMPHNGASTHFNGAAAP